MRNQELYPIGDAARRSGLSVSAVRFYADEGLVEPTRLNEAGHRLYDIDTIARLELVRTLRELDTELDEIRRLLEGGTTLHDLLTTHLGIVERQEHALRARRAVLRTLIRQGCTTAQADLMHKLISMTDEEREQIIDAFWNEVGEGLDVPDGFVDRLRTMRPVLSADPTAAQLEAWIELGDLVRDPAFRDAVRNYLRETYTTDVGRDVASAPFQDFVHENGGRLVAEVLAAYRAGESPRSPWAQQAVTRFMEAATALSDTPLTPEVRNRMADGYRRLPDMMRRIAEEEAAAESPVYDDTHGRYLSLVAVINGTESEDIREEDSTVFTWIADAMRASTPA
ncbi:MerR family transcriptional regulator [Marinitenerispora sediminis]|uniref:MerR family transcriptional regulator n=1 Tax=Marinitenerispora sediminis TaxID=1931232 RepID=A0A368T5B3_9ACTN|nr:MerR family transcriptional regulator [Marinitenerispora sediminis]RCV57274.1 MerR family transcriptional regulator [Marinitenerispora sediminis]RCV58265.1 MerR family transcriptional regulator [Marinitenerispora sediminis]RCV58486.1 MerR family transcriptional regulator [Marinitenerispora sediminis]